MKQFALALLVLPVLLAQGTDYIKANYTKYEYQIPMRDGKKLFTSVYVPKNRATPLPIMLLRTPYGAGPYGSDNYRASLGPSDLFAREGFIFAYQDVRGRGMSEGEFVNARPHNPRKGPKDIDEGTDAWDTIDWLLKRVPDNNGRVGMWGISYPGFYVSTAMIDAHPALKAASPQAPISDWFVGDDFHHNGAFFLAHAFNFLNFFGHPRPEPAATQPPRAPITDSPNGYDYLLRLGPLVNINERVFKNDIAFWNELMRHGTYDAFWQARNLRPHLRKIRPAVMTVGGWFDAEDLFGALQTYAAVEKNSPGASNMLVMGPWQHGGWARNGGTHLGNVRFGSSTSQFFREKMELPFFNYHLKDKGTLDLPEAWVFETGTNQWMRYDAWPPKDAKPRTLYFHAGGKLGFDPPRADGHDEYVSDPSKPVPFIGGIDPGMTVEYMVEDQRFASTRPDVLVYESDVLEADVSVAGPVTPSLHVATTGTDSDWVVKLIDVYPDNYPNPDPNPAGVKMGGYQQLVRGDAMRGKFRNSFEKPEPFEPSKPAKVEYVMPDVAHVFRRGHRIMVQVQSSWFPLVDRNPQKFLDIYNARPEDFQKATQRVYRTRTQPSGVRVLVR
ncbi:MAG TPA: CocE/NonD family hydrolase [Bryobacteraceae bacterium]|nr:CocE/NonD family hydrolase [Bryobacteraceae bacterium]